MPKLTNAELTKLLESARTELTTFKALVKATTEEYPGGCREGKKDFLRDLGLQEELGGTYKVSFIYTIDEEEVDDFEADWDDNFDAARFFEQQLERADLYVDLLEIVEV